MKTIAVTGTSGFVGKRLVDYDKYKYGIRSLSLREKKPADLDLHNIDAIIHLAGKAHDMRKTDDRIYFDVNYELTRELADTAKKNGVRQFIYISSTKVYGDDIHEVLDEASPCHPTDAYGASKLKAEQYLQSVQTESFKVAIIRPPLVYGPGVKGNMIRLLQLAAKNIPLPLAKTNNARSMVFVDNLVELINKIIDREAAGIFIAGDKEPLSTTDLISQMRKSMGNKKKLINIPVGLRKLIRHVKPSLYTRLFGSFEVDTANTNVRLQFVPPYSTEEGVSQMVNWFISLKNK